MFFSFSFLFTGNYPDKSADSIANDQTLKKCNLHICADDENMLKYKNAGDNILSTREKRYNQKERDS